MMIENNTLNVYIVVELQLSLKCQLKMKSSVRVWKVKEIIKLIEKDGWFLVRTRGDHRQFKHPTKKGKVTVPGKKSDDLAPNTAKSILNQAGL